MSLCFTRSCKKSISNLAFTFIVFYVILVSLSVDVSEPSNGPFPLIFSLNASNKELLGFVFFPER